MGDRVMVRYDNADAGRIYVFEACGAFICMAQNPTLTGVSRKEIAWAMKQHEKESIGEQKKALKAKGRKLNQEEAVQKALAAKKTQDCRTVRQRHRATQSQPYAGEQSYCRSRVRH